jgi:hypothetical protein
MSGKMTTQEIVRAAVKRAAPKTDWRKTYATISMLIQSPKFRLMRTKNTLFLFYNMGNHNAYIDWFTADQAEHLPQSMKDFLASMKKCGFKEVMFSGQTQAFVGAMQRAGYKPTILSQNTPGLRDGKVDLQ